MEFTKEQKIKMIYDRHARVSQQFIKDKKVADFIKAEHELTEKLQAHDISPQEYLEFVNLQLY